MNTTMSQYYKRLTSTARLHFLADFLLPLLGELPVVDFIIVEVHSTRRENGLTYYCARADFGHGVKSHWYDVRFMPTDGSKFQVTGVYKALFGQYDAVAYVDLSHEDMYRVW